VDGRQRQSVQLREPERGVVNVLAVPLTRRTTSSDHNRSSPTIDEQERGVTKPNVGRCHGTYEHGIFRRDTTPEYTEGDRRRPPSPVPGPIRVGHFTSTVTALVSDHIAKVMLGIDWLEDNNSFWDFQQATVRLGRHYYGLRRRRGPRQWCSCLAGRCQCSSQVTSRCAGKDSFPWSSGKSR